MKKYDNNDDPIQEVGGNKLFSKLKSFENDLEYKFQKEMEDFEKYLDEEKLKEEENYKNMDYSNSNNYSATSNTNINSDTNNSSFSSIYFMYFVFICVIVGFAFTFILGISREDTGARVVSESSVYYDEENTYNNYRLDSEY